MARNWEKEFYKVSEVQEREEAEFSEKLQLLNRSIVRLCMSTNGLDPFLDPYLNKLKLAAKSNDVEAVSVASGKMADAMVKRDDEALQTPDLFARILSHASSRQIPVGEIQKIVQQYNKSPNSVSDTQIDKVLSLLGGASASSASSLASSQKKSGLFNRLLSRSDDSDNEYFNPHDVLLVLLEKLDWPGRVQQDISRLQKRLAKESGLPNNWRKNVEDIAHLISDMLSQAQTEIQSAEDFLVQVTGQLEALDDFVRNGRQQRKASLESSDQLGKTLDEHVDGMRTTIQDANDLAILKTDVMHSLQVIEKHVHEHVAGERNRHRNAELSEQELVQKTTALEEQMQALRSELRQAHRRAYTDAVTGIANRMAYEERVADEYARWKRFNSYLILMVWDVDDFKKVNDRFGHQSGDKALRIIAQILKKRIRKTDFIGRYGGEEIVVLLTGTPLIEAVDVANQMRKEIADSGFHSGGKKVELTISCGLSEFLQGDTIETVFKRADEALYQAKSEGKNRVISR